MEELKNNFIHDIIDEDLAENPELKILINNIVYKIVL